MYNNRKKYYYSKKREVKSQPKYNYFFYTCYHALCTWNLNGRENMGINLCRFTIVPFEIYKLYGR